MFKTLLSTRTPDGSPLSSDHLENLARKNSLIQRKSSQTSASGIVYTLLKATVDGESSFAELGGNLHHYNGVPISRQALHKRLNANAVSFMQDVCAFNLARKWAHPRLVQTKHFKRVLIEDSTQVQMHPANNTNFKAHGNFKGATAAYKVDLCWDLLSGESVSLSCGSALDNDKKAGKKLINDHLSKGDLLLRDMGYYSLEAFKMANDQGAYWLSKVPSNVILRHEGKDIDELLADTHLDRLDLRVKLNKGKFAARMIAVRASPEQAAQRQRRARTQAANHGKTQRKNAKIRNQWHILLTNIPESWMDKNAITGLYSLRWQIETIFKAWKQSSNFKKCFNKSSNPNHLKCLLLASLLWMILNLKTIARLQSKYLTWLSVRKVAKVLSRQLLRLSALEEIEVFEPDIRTISFETRQRKSLLQKIQPCLS